MGSKSNKGRDKIILAIASLKVVKGVLLLAVAIGAFRLAGKNLSEELTRCAQYFNVDPNSHYFHLLFSKVSGMDSKKLELLSIGTFFYAGLFLTEGIGLFFRQEWAEYLTAIITASFMPLEIYEIVKELNWFRIAVLIVNAAIVIYLVYRLRTKKRRE
jgi:uncharacterized membrane protein (DUF2068 family)